MKIPTSITIALACLTPLASSQTFTTIATESFDYPAGSLDGMNGGTGWLLPWSGANASVTAPGFDAIGNKAMTSVEHGGNWRTIDAGPLPLSSWTIDSNGNPAFGVDGTTVWLTYSQQRVAGGDQDYGGLSLTGLFLGEKLFIGSPGGSNELGVDSSFCCGGPLDTIPATSADTLHELVVKVEFQTGAEDVSLWLDPAVPHPDPNVTPPDLVSSAPDFLFNEIRMQSGSGTGGFDFDSILIELEESGSLGTNYCVANVNASGNPAPMSASGSASIAANNLVLSCGPVPPGQPGIFFYSTTQAANPSGIPFGEGQRCAIGAISRLLPPVFPDGMGNLNRPVDYNNLPAGGAITAGSTWNFQGWYRDTGDSNGDGTASSFNLSDGLEVMFTP